MASPRYSRRSLFSAAPSRTERCVNAVLYNEIFPGKKPRIFFSCFLKDGPECLLKSVLKKSTKIKLRQKVDKLEVYGLIS